MGLGGSDPERRRTAAVQTGEMTLSTPEGDWLLVEDGLVQQAAVAVDVLDHGQLGIEALLPFLCELTGEVVQQPDLRTHVQLRPCSEYTHILDQRKGH